MIDTHCHVDMYKNPIALAKESESLGIITIGMTNLPSHFELGYPHLLSFKKVRLALGLHPLHAESHEKELQLFFDCMHKTSYIGEVGLDFSREGIATKDLQVNSFQKILQGMIGHKKILSLHSRRAEKEVFNYLKEYGIKAAIFHWYSGPLTLIDEIVKAGYFFSINPAMIKSQSGQAIINRIPISNILTESDGPFIEFHSRQVKPLDVKYVEEYLSQVFKIPQPTVSEIIHSNFRNILKFLE